jgi:two-component system NtrC family sensor kinase
MQDISSMKESEDELKRLNEDLRKNERAVLNILSDLKRSHEDLKSSQDQLVRQAKLASLGRLVSDMAHEVNNPLMVISGRAQLGLMEGTTPQEIRENFGIIVDQCARAKEIIERLLVFSRTNKGAVKAVSLNDVVEFVAKLLEYQYSIHNVKIIREYDTQLPAVSVDEKQMHEVFMNIIKNSAEAMPHGGTVTIKTKWQRENVMVEIADTGIGIPASLLNEIFDPFFTTKEHGTGLGLAVCYGIVKSHGGDMVYKSTEGKGTTATVIIPAAKKES